MPYEGMANSMDGQNSVLSVVGPLATTPRALKLVTQALLSTKPWLHDPLVHEIPWRTDAELAISDPVRRFSKPLTFGVIRNDGSCTPTPPVARAVETVVKALEKKGHTVIDWKPTPNHARVTEVCYKVWNFDGGKDLRDSFKLSGEDQAPQALVANDPVLDATVIMETNIAKREVQKDYMEYWNSTADKTGTGEPVDAIISPLAPFPAARENAYTYYGYSSWVNLLDYTSVVVPVTNVDKSVDKKYSDFKAIDDADQKTQDTCKSSSLLATTALQTDNVVKMTPRSTMVLMLASNSSGADCKRRKCWPWPVMSAKPFRSNRQSYTALIIAMSLHSNGYKLSFDEGVLPKIVKSPNGYTLLPQKTVCRRQMEVKVWQDVFRQVPLSILELEVTHLRLHQNFFDFSALHVALVDAA